MNHNFYVLTNKKHHWLLNGFVYLWNKYTENRRLTIVSYGDEDDLIISNILENNPWISFLSIADENYPAKQWSTGVIRFLNLIEDEHFGLMLEDYWLTHDVDLPAIDRIKRLPKNCVRFDISGNRAAYIGSDKIISIKIVGNDPYGLSGRGYQTIASYHPTPYQVSFQAAIWSRRELLRLLMTNETPWEVEIEGNERLPRNKFVLGSKPALMRYVPIWMGKQRRYQLEKLNPDDLEFIKSQGWLVSGHGIVGL